MGLNLKALKGIQEDLNKRGEGTSLFLYQNEIGEETDVRLLPPLPHMNGIYFIEQIVYWINGKPYTSPETFGEPCPIEAEVEAAKDSGDHDLAELIDSDDFRKKSKFLMPILLLDCEFDDDGECTKANVVDGKAKILDVGPMLMKRMNKVITSRNFQNGTENGIMDREKGFNLILSKTGKKLDTKYDAIGWNTPFEMEEKFYKNYPDVIEIVKKGQMSDEYLESVIRNYLYGEEVLDDKEHKRHPELQKSDSKNDAKDEKKSSRPKAAARPSRTAKKEEEKPAARTSTRKSTTSKKEEAPKKTGRRNLLKDLGDLD